MSDHAWVQEHIAPAIVDGLTPEETERFDAHVRDCRECAAALDEASTLDRKLQALFAPDRPGPALEDRAIQALRAAAARKRRLLSGWERKLAIGVAASVGIMVTGATMDRIVGLNGLPMPGSLAAQSSPVAMRSGRPGEPSVVDNSGSMATDPNSDFIFFHQTNPLKQQQLREGGSKSASNSGTTSGSDSASSTPQKVYQSPADPTIQNGLSSNQTGSNGWPASSYAANYQVLGTVNNLLTSGAPPANSPVDPGNAAFYNSAASALLARARGTPSDKLDVFQSGGQSQPATGEGSSLGYIKPSDLADRLPGSKVAGAGEAGDFRTPILPPIRGPEAAVPAPVPPPQSQEKGEGQAPAEKAVPAKPAPPAPPAEPASPRKIIIRSGDMEFEVESFDVAVATVTRLVIAIDGAFVATVNSEKLPNGKVKGSVALRVPPDRLDTLFLDLRKELGKAGELKGQRIGSQDITKQYTDLESRLRAARTMETRLLQIIKEGKGEIKQLLEVEKELGVWRTRIEEYEGELRYFGNLAALSTLTVTLEEREIRAAVTTTERERVQAGVEVEDVDKTLQDALAAVAEAKGRVTKSELKQLAAGQFNATLHCELAPVAAGPFRDRLKQLGRVARLEIDRVLQSEGGTAVRDAKVTRGDTQFLVQFYNLANVAPRETTTALVAVHDVPSAYAALREAIDKAKGRVITSKLEEQDRLNVTAQLDFEVRRADESALLAALNAAGEVVSRNVARAAEGDNLTDSKMLFRTALVSALRVRPRETTTLTLEVPDVDGSVAVFGALVAEAKGRVADSQSTHEHAGRDSARLVYDVPLSAASSLVEKFKAAGAVRAQHSVRDLQAPDGRYATARLDVTLANTDPIVAKDDGLWPQVRRGLSFSVTVLLTSVTWIVFGLCVLLPWAAVGYGGYRVFRRLAPPTAAAPPAPPSAPPAA